MKGPRRWNQVLGVLRSTKDSLFGSKVLPPTPPALPALEPVDFPDPQVVDSRHPDLVVDFGTTATVVALVEDIRALNGGKLVRLNLLAGETEHSSDMSITPAGQVAKVGAAAYGDTLSGANRYYTSLKRYMELESRGCSQGISFADIVSGFLQESIRERYRALRDTIGSNSRIVISVPNSFNPKAVEDVRQGVIQAITQLNGANDGVGAHNIRVARESEAVAYLYRRGLLLAPAPTLEGAAARAGFEWRIIHPAENPAAKLSNGSERLIVLDVGGGTTDLSLVEVVDTQDQHGGQDVRIRVVINAGLPLGGTDVDKLLLRAAIDPKITTAEQLAALERSVRFQLLKLIREQKHSGAEQFFAAPQDSGEDGFGKTLAEILTKLPGENIKHGVVVDGEASEDTIADYRRQVTNRIGKLIRLSITGLFDLIPDSAKTGITKILLTGRASQLRQIQEAVIDEAKKLGAEVLSLNHPYHLKLAVAYGCALVRDDEFSGARLPSGTLGRQLQVLGARSSPLVEFTGDFPVSGEAPTLLEVTCTSPEKNSMSYELCEYRTALPLDFFRGDDAPSHDEVMWMGCFRSAAAWDVGIRGAGRPNQRVNLAWHPASEQYYSVDQRHTPLRWSQPSATSFDLTGINFVTGLPLGFPHEDGK